MLAKRLDRITEILEEQKSVEVIALSKLLGVTEKTIRQDLTKLEQMQIASRVHGGAVLMRNENDIYAIKTRKQGHSEEKLRIARCAMDLIDDGDIIILDSGTTAQCIAEMLDKSVIVITNDPYSASILLSKEKVTLYVSGGRLKRERGSYTYVGPDAIRTIANYHANKYFMACSALSFEQGLMVFSAEEAEVKKAMLRASEQVICVLDYSKFHKIAFSSLAKLDIVNHIITDSDINEEDIMRIEKMGIKLTIA